MSTFVWLAFMRSWSWMVANIVMGKAYAFANFHPQGFSATDDGHAVTNVSEKFLQSFLCE